MPIHLNHSPIIVHLTPQDDVVCLTGYGDKYTYLSFADRIPNFDYKDTQLTHPQLGAQLSLIFESVVQIDNLIAQLEDIKQVQNAIKAG
jgi:hypothetical protein